MKANLLRQLFVLLASTPSVAHPASLISFADSAPHAYEGSPMFTLWVERTGDPIAQVSVDYAFQDGRATNGVDYVAVPGTLVFMPGEPRQSINLAILNDGLRESGETFRVVLGNPTGDGTLGVRAAVNVTIDDNDSGFYLSAQTLTVTEDAGEVRVIVYRGNDFPGAVSVDYATSDAAATHGVDYIGIAGTLVFGSNEQQRTLVIPILNDRVKENTETFRLRLSNPSPGTGLGLAVFTVTIQDNDLGVEFESPAQTVSEGEATVRVTVRRQDELAGPVSVDYATSDGSATNRLDYVATSGTLTFGPGEFRQQIEVPLLNDALRERNETFRISLSNPAGGGTVGQRKETVLAIVDNDSGIEFTQGLYEIGESASQAVVTLQRLDDSNVPATVEFRMLPESATEGGDYADRTTVLSFTAQETQKTITVPIFNDSLLEISETVRLILTNAAGGLGLGTRSTARLRILNDDLGFRFENTSYSASEQRGIATAVVLRGYDVSGQASVEFSSEDGLATAGTDYSMVSGTLLFAIGETRKEIHVPLLNDALHEGPETLRLILTNASPGASLGNQRTATMNIQDNEIGFQFAHSTFETSENAQQGVITVERTDEGTTAATVDYATQGRAAVAGEDYVEQFGTLSFASGETHKAFAVSILNDGIPENVETLDLTLTNPGAGSFLGARTTAILRISDNDSGTGLASNSFEAREQSGPAQIAVHRGDDGPGIVTVQYATVPGTATPGLDYLDQTGTLSFAPGERMKVIQIPILNDTLAEPAETVLVQLNAITGGPGVHTLLGAVLTIQDNDQGFTLTSGSELTERSGLTHLVVRRGDDGPFPATVTYRVSGGTAARGVDFELTDGTLEFASGSSEASIPLTVLDDSIAEGDETIDLVLADITSKSESDVHIGIQDDERPLWVDPGFIPDLPADIRLLALGQQVDGRVIVGFRDSTSINQILRLNTDGGRDSTFAIALVEGQTEALALSRDGQVLVGGSFTAINGVTRYGLARLNVNGSLDASFDAGTLIREANRFGSVYTLAEADDGTLIVAGEFKETESEGRLPVVVLRRDGSPDPTFVRPEAAAPIRGRVLVRYVGIDAGGSTLVAGNFETVAGLPRNGLVRLKPDGSIDLAFKPNLSPGADIHNLAVQGDRKILVSGQLQSVDGIPRAGLARLNPDGSLDLTYDSRRAGGDPIEAALQLPDGRVYASGRNLQFGGATYFGLVRLGATGGVDSSFSLSATLTRWILAAPNNTILIAGDFDTVGDLPRRRLARLFIDGSASAGVQWTEAGVVVEENGGDATLHVERLGNSTGTVTVNFVTVPGSAISGTDFVAANGTLTFAPFENQKTVRIALLDDGAVDAAEDFRVELADVSAGALLAGRREATVEIRDNEVPATLDRSFAPGSDFRDVQALAVQPDGKVVFSAYWPEFESDGPWRLVRINLDGSLDSTFRTNTIRYDPVRAMAIDRQGRFVIGGYFSEVDGVARPGLARLNADGSLDATFEPPAEVGGGALEITVDEQGVMLVLVECGSLWRVQADGSLDRGFRAALSALNCARRFAVDTGGKVLVAGDPGGLAPNQPLIRLNADGRVDSTFHAPRFALPPEQCCVSINDLEVLPDGRSVAGGVFSTVNGLPRASIVRLNSDGSVDLTFAPAAGATTSSEPGAFPGSISAVAVDVTGRILVGGYFNTLNGQPRQGLGRLNPDGSLDLTLGPLEMGGARFWRADVRFISLLPDRKLLIGGSFNTINRLPRPGLARAFDDSGRTSFEFTETAAGTSESAGSATLTVRRLGDISEVAAVRFATGRGTAQDGIDYQSQSTVLTFKPLESAATVAIPILDDEAEELDKTVTLELTEATDVSSPDTFKVELRILDNERAGSMDSSYTPSLMSDEFGNSGSVNRRGLALLSDDSVVLMGGFYTSTNSESYRNRVWLDAGGSMGPSAQPADPANSIILLPDGRAVARDGNDLVLLNADGSRYDGFRARVSQSLGINHAALQADGDLVIATVDCSSGPCRTRILRFNTDGSLDAAFFPPTLSNSSANVVLIDSEDRIVIGGNSGLASSPLRAGVIRLLLDGSLDPAFVPPAPSPSLDSHNANVLIEQPDGKIVIGGWLSIPRGNDRVASLVRLLPDGLPDPEFVGGTGTSDAAGNPTSDISALALQPDGKLLVSGPFRQFHGVPARGLVRLNSDGTLDRTFDIGEGFRFQRTFEFDGYASVEALALLPNGQILAAGNFTHFNGLLRPLLVRLNGDGRAVFQSFAAVSSGRARLGVGVQPGRIYILEISEDLRQWMPASTNTATATTIVWEDDRAGREPMSFYRVRRR